MPKSFHAYLLPALAKGFSVFYLLLLSTLYGEKLITAQQVGVIGAVLIVLLIVAAFGVSRWLHAIATRNILQIAAVGALLSSVLLFFGTSWHTLSCIIVAYGLMGLAVGVARSGTNALSARSTDRGNRFTALARYSIATDILIIFMPAAIAGSILIGAGNLVILVATIAACLFFLFGSQVPVFVHDEKQEKVLDLQALGRNRLFRFVLGLEFLDSLVSSQLFVFLPVLFLFKGYSLQNSLLLQSCIFGGYLCGRLLVSMLARQTSGIQAVAIAETGMAVCIALLLLVHPLALLYVLSFMLGMCARGTSPAIKALAFDALRDNQVKQGSALHVVAGDSGSALGQLGFGLLIAWIGVATPFIAAAVIAVGIAGACFTHSPLRRAA